MSGNERAKRMSVLFSYTGVVFYERPMLHSVTRIVISFHTYGPELSSSKSLSRDIILNDRLKLKRLADEGSNS